MTVPLRDYDFAAARQRLASRVDPTTRLVRDARGGYDFERTRLIRTLEDGVDDVLGHLEILIVAALCELPVAEGGLVIGAQALATAMTADQPLVRALLILGSHPRHPGFTHRALAAGGRGVPVAWHDTPHDAGPFLAQQPRASWSVAAFEAAVQLGVVAVYGDVQVDPDRLTFEQAPGSKLGAWLRILGASALYDAIGAWEPGFSARDALAGEWWLLQPTSPRLAHDEVAARAGLELRGFLPPASVDVSGRVVLVCYPRGARSEEARAEELADTKWIAGWRHVVWAVDDTPLALIDELARDGAYKHSTELPEFGPAPAAPGKTRAQALAEAVLDALSAPEDVNQAALEAQNDRRKAKIAEASYLRTRRVQPRPARVFVGPARTLDELRFAASLEFCPTCNDRLDPAALELRDLSDGSWEVAGPCSRCKSARSHRYLAAAQVERATHAAHEPGPVRPR